VNLIAEDQATWSGDIWTQFISNLEEAQKKYKENVDKHHKDQPNFKVKDQVWFQWQNIKITQLSKKLDYQKLGLFTIVKQINIVAFQLKLPNSMKIHSMFHVSLLEPYHVTTILGKTHKPPPPIIINGEQEYEVEEILNSRISHFQL
jgi:hypothetical protein